MKKISIDETTKNEILLKFRMELEKARTNFNFNAKLFEDVVLKPEQKPVVVLSALALHKMEQYVKHCSNEVAWHGTVTREDNFYYITDVFLYPQEVTSVTVNSVPEKYSQWIEQLPDEVLNSMRFQGHSHVNMGVTPSGTDTSYWREILVNLRNDDYYVFMILNKSGSMHFNIFDLAANAHYDNVDIAVAYDDDVFDAKAELDKFIIKKPVTPITTGRIQNPEWWKNPNVTTPATTKPATTAPQQTSFAKQADEYARMDNIDKFFAEREGGYWGADGEYHSITDQIIQQAEEEYIASMYAMTGATDINFDGSESKRGRPKGNKNKNKFKGAGR